nr:WD40 repeat domain-containing protein [Bacteroides sp. 519]
MVEKREFPTEKKVDDFVNTTYCMTILSKGFLYTVRDYPVLSQGKIQQTSFNPTGSSLAILQAKKPISVYSFRKSNTKLFELKEKRKKLEAKPQPIAMCYSSDARHFVVSNSLKEIVIYDTREYLPQAYIQDEAPATMLAMSTNNYFIAAVANTKINIWNFQTKELRTSLQLPAEVTGIAFSQDASTFAVTTNDDVLTIYDTRSWEITYKYQDLGGTLKSPSFHPEGKYLSVIKNNQEIVILNLRNKKVEQTIVEDVPGIFAGRFFADNQRGDMFLLSNRPKSLMLWDANPLNPFFGKILNKEVEAKMNEWVKMMEGESMEDYAIRVNDETRIKQREAFAQEIATGMAGDRISVSNPFIEAYDATDNLLTIGFNNMSSIDIKVPENERDSFKDSKDLKFSNAVYVLNENDEFEIAYLEVLNETTNKVYIYDNIGRTKLEALEEEDFVPLEIMQQVTREEVQLKEALERLVAENKQEKLITDNTQINVNAEVLKSTNADGKNILNYKVIYQYEVVNKEFSASEDFPSGGYVIERSNAAMALMKIIKDAFEGEISKYLSEGKQVKIIITGSADASPIRGKIAYNNNYGEFIDEPYYKDGNLDNITVTKATGITQNEQLALLRAAGVKHYIENNVETLSNTHNEFDYKVEVAKERGGEYRKISVEFMIIDVTFSH